MKKIFKLAAIAVSVALATSLVACSSGDDDVVDASTPKYLVTAQINSYVDSIEYDQNVSDAEIESIKKENEDVLNVLGDCEDCLAVYLEWLKSNVGGYYGENDYGRYWVQQTLYTSDYERASSIKGVKARFNVLKTNYSKHDDCHKFYVYLPAIEKALNGYGKKESYFWKWDTPRGKVEDIGEYEGDKILDRKLNDRQAENMTEYLDAAAALKAALNKDDAKKCENKIKAADDAIKVFNDLKNEGVTKAAIEKVTNALDAMYEDVNKNVYNELLLAKKPDTKDFN